MEGANYIFPKEKHALIHEARIRRELILLCIEDDEVYIHGSSHERKYVFRRSLLRRKALKCPWLSIHIRDPMMKGRSGIFRVWNL
jgi:hypothetical protein